jgi:hypothetical protein
VNREQRYAHFLLKISVEIERRRSQEQVTQIRAVRSKARLRAINRCRKMEKAVTLVML